MTKFRWPALLLAAVAVIALACGDDDDDSPSPTRGGPTPSTTTTANTPPHTSTPTHAPSDDPTGGPGDDPTNAPGDDGGGDDVSLLTPVDKQHALPDDYAPPGLSSLPIGYLAPGYEGSLREEAADALVRMLDGADATGFDIRLRSGYRSYAEQEVTFQYWVDTLGYDEAVRVSAMPGHSEHQLGTTADVTSADVGWELSEAFGSTPGGEWLAEHSHEFGFVLSYPAGAEPITGYTYEPWHFRYIGVGSAAAWKASGQTLNQYLAS